MASVVSHQAASRSRGRRRTRRRSMAPDMTALVDIALLLLMFFMVSTSWNTPTVMEMSMPEGESPVPVSQVLSVVVQPDGLLKCSYRDETATISPGDLAGIVAEATALMKSVPLIAVDAGDNVRYGSVVDVLDELMLAGVDIRSVRKNAVVLNNIAGLSY